MVSIELAPIKCQGTADLRAEIARLTDRVAAAGVGGSNTTTNSADINIDNSPTIAPAFNVNLPPAPGPSSPLPPVVSPGTHLLQFVYWLTPFTMLE